MYTETIFEAKNILKNNRDCLQILLKFLLFQLVFEIVKYIIIYIIVFTAIV